MGRNALDLIIVVADEELKTADDFLCFIEAKNPGDRVVLTVVLSGREIKVALFLTAGE